MATTAKNTDAALEVSDQAEYIHYLTEAPIADFAKYAGIDIDEAVNRRVAAAVEAAPLKVEVNVKPIEPRGKLIGVADVRFGGGVVVEDFKLFNGENGLWVGPPSKPDNTARSGFRRTARITDDRVQAALDNAAFEGYNAAVEKLQARAAAVSAPEKPRIREQLDRAAQEAAKDNAARPAQTKEKAARDDR